MAKLPAITGKQLVSLLKKDGWVEVRRSTHGVFLAKGRLSTVVQNTSKSLPRGTLLDILGTRQTQIGRNGLQRLIDVHGL